MINPNDSLLNQNDQECNPMCLSHALFYIELLEKCSDNCKSNNILKYSNNYFIYEIYPLEILSLIKKSQLTEIEIKGQLFSLTKLAIVYIITSINLVIIYSYQILNNANNVKKINCFYV